MAEEALRVKVNVDVYQKTLDELEGEIERLRSQQTRLETNIERLKSGNIFYGTAVVPAIKKAEDALEKVKDLRSRVQGYKVAIQEELENVKVTNQQLASDMSDIDLPNMFK